MKIIQRSVLFSLAWAVACAASAAVPQYTLTTLATFNYANGATPSAGLIADAAGNLYGTTYSGGVGGNGYGVVFKVANNTNHTLSTLASFDYVNGANSTASLIFDAAGNLYGTATHSGSDRGTVFKVANDANRTLSTLAAFNIANGAYPQASLIADAAGNLYDTTNSGGVGGDGTVFKVANDVNHTLSTLASFNYTNGGAPIGGLVADAAGNLYGTTQYGGASGNGTVFEVANDANHTLSALASFNGANGSGSEAGLIMDAAGNLYGTTSGGGDLTLNNGSGYGTVFEVSPVPEPTSFVLGLLALLGALPFLPSKCPAAALANTQRTIAAVPRWSHPISC